jgi:hypothetical protein
MLHSHGKGWDLAERLEKCVGVLKIAGLNPSGGRESTFRFDLRVLTARGTRAPGRTHTKIIVPRFRTKNRAKLSKKKKKRTHKKQQTN